MNCASNMVINKSVFNFVNIHDDNVDEEVFKGKKVFHRKPKKKQYYTFLIEELIKSHILMRQQGILMEELQENNIHVRKN